MPVLGVGLWRLSGAGEEILVGNRRILVGGDIITAIDGEAIQDWLDYLEFLELETDVADEVSVSIVRGGEELTVKATLIAKP